MTWYVDRYNEIPSLLANDCAIAEVSVTVSMTARTLQNCPDAFDTKIWAVPNKIVW